ncbi:MAG TPA: hypothetical protein VFY13_01850 [Luteolibacter sp.]|nr:hypothetical protein [Luteolibacter sp.]
MSPREKKLLILFAAAGFIMINLIGLAQFRSKRASIEQERQQAHRRLQTAKLFQQGRQQAQQDMEWLEANQPQPAENQDVQVALEALCSAEARKQGLELKDRDVLPSDTTAGRQYHRAKIRFQVSGSEEALYRWCLSISSPKQLRAVTQLILSPSKQDETRIDCTATFEQWFVPVAPTT